ncbi:hypothetical protein [Butyrivibrio sp. AE3003]|uniref:hypothetical protein n=1 Tax=Butyrivibrio sp. AE3003 TaxID=1496721 RepID=UPI00047A05EB|nr:hypothetical protein [Butyrivibrio sp. AE3003]
METTVTLRPPFEYSIWVLLVGIVIFAAFLFMFVWVLLRILGIERNQSDPSAKKENRFSISSGYQYIMKQKYIAQIQMLKNDYKNGKVSQREGFQRLSLLIRGFIHDVTGINVETATIRDVKKLGIKHLDKLMEEYYVPEFAEDGRPISKELSESCETAMGVIRTWT